MGIWHKSIPPKVAHKQLGMYRGVWMPHMDHCWESEDGYSVMSRKIRTEVGVVEHVTITRMGVNKGDIPWAEKQRIKNELFGEHSIAIEVYPDERNLVDVCDVYHLWILPKGSKIPFGIHPTRDPQGVPVQRGFDWNIQEVKAWCDSEERRRLMGDGDTQTPGYAE